MSPIVKWLAIIAAIMWMGLVGFEQFGDMGATDYGSAQFRKQMAQCQGDYQHRSECVQKLMLKTSNATFVDWSERIAMVLLPPLLIYLFLPGLRRLYRKLSGTEPVRKKPVRRRPRLPEPGETTPHQPTHHS